MEAVHVLGRADAVQGPFRIQRLRERQLHQDAVDLRIGVQPVDEGVQVRLGGLRGQAIHGGPDAHLAQAAALFRT